MNDSKGINFDAILEGITATVSNYGVRVIGAIAVLILGRMIAGIVRSTVRKALHRTALDKTLIPFVSNLVYYTLFAFVVVAVLNLFGIETTSFIAVMGAAGLAVGLALQGTLSNFSAGVMLLVFRPFKVGDYIEAGGTSGSVIEIGVFSTTLHSPDNVKIVVPNASVYGTTVKNYSANETRRNDIVVGIAYSDDIGKAIETIGKLLSEDQRILKEPAPMIAVSELGDSSVNLVVRPWCHRDHYWPLRFDLTRRLKERLEAAGCSIPFPQHDVHLYREAGPAAG